MNERMSRSTFAERLEYHLAMADRPGPGLLRLYRGQHERIACMLMGGDGQHYDWEGVRYEARGDTLYRTLPT